VKLIVGLGNPGTKYAETRHNAGVLVLERLAEREAASWELDRGLRARIAWLEREGGPHLLLLPQTFMNRSGESVVSALRRWPDIGVEEDLIVVYDDLDLPTGRIRLRPSGGAGGHRGMADIVDRLETRSIPRLRFGIGHPGDSASVVDWVLERFAASEQAELSEALDRAADAILSASSEGVSRAMGRFNAVRSRAAAQPSDEAG